MIMKKLMECAIIDFKSELEFVFPFSISSYTIMKKYNFVIKIKYKIF